MGATALIEHLFSHSFLLLKIEFLLMCWVWCFEIAPMIVDKLIYTINVRYLDCVTHIL